jgi:DNA repair exonuclease SbcCD ATPase subunit
MAFVSRVMLASVCLQGAGAVSVSEGSGLKLRRANPIRRVVTMIQDMEKKVQAEGKAEEELYEKFFCYCKNGAASLGASIAAAEEKIPQLQSSITQTEEELAQLTSSIDGSKKSRAEAKAAVAEATSLRGKEAGEFGAYKAEAETNIAAMAKALAALEKGSAGSFLQTASASVLKKLVTSIEMSSSDRDMMTSFLSEGSDSDSSDSGEIIGVLKQLKETMEGDLADATKKEEESVAAFNGLVAAKTKEIDALTKSIEDSIARNGEAGVELTNLKEDLDDTSAALAENKKFLADMDKNCAQKKKEQEERAKMRADELVALAETITMLNSDDALELFKKQLPAASFLQVRESQKDVRQRAKKALGHGHTMRLDLISIALNNKKVNFDKVLTMIDDMVALLKKEQEEDTAKKEYCNSELDKSDDTMKQLNRKSSDLSKAADEAKSAIATLEEELAALAAGIADLDKQVAEAGAQRKSENKEFRETLTGNTAAIDLLKMAKNRMNKFYNPKLYKEEALDQESSGQAPATPGAYEKKGEESTGVIAMLDLIIGDVTKENTVMEQEEKDAQADYEQFTADAATKRGEDSKSVEDKSSAKADAESNLETIMEDTKRTNDATVALEQTIMALHADCDFLLQNYDMRKGARSGEVDALKKAKAVLSGADFALLQTASMHTISRA